MTQELIPKLKVGDWIAVEGFAFRLEEFTQTHNKPAKVKFIATEEISETPKEQS